MKALPRAPATLLHRAQEIGIKAGLEYVYCGNIPGEEAEEDTFCPHYGKRCVERIGFRVIQTMWSKMHAVTVKEKSMGSGIEFPLNEAVRDRRFSLNSDLL
jgi:hypothetical protein